MNILVLYRELLSLSEAETTALVEDNFEDFKRIIQEKERLIEKIKLFKRQRDRDEKFKEEEISSLHVKLREVNRKNSLLIQQKQKFNSFLLDLLSSSPNTYTLSGKISSEAFGNLFEFIT